MLVLINQLRIALKCQVIKLKVIFIQSEIQQLLSLSNVLQKWILNVTFGDLNKSQNLSENFNDQFVVLNAETFILYLYQRLENSINIYRLDSVSILSLVDKMSQNLANQIKDSFFEQISTKSYFNHKVIKHSLNLLILSQSHKSCHGKDHSFIELLLFIFLLSMIEKSANKLTQDSQYMNDYCHVILGVLYQAYVDQCIENLLTDLSVFIIEQFY